MKTVIILGQEDSAEVQSIKAHTMTLGYHCEVINTRYFGLNVSIEYSPKRTHAYLIKNGNRIDLSAVVGAYIARINPPTATLMPRTMEGLGIDNKEHLNLQNACLLQLLLSLDNINWLNSFSSIQFHKVKPKQLTLAYGLGASIPCTYIGKNVSAIHTFIREHKDCIIKPLYSGYLSQRIHCENANMAFIEQISHTAFTLQNYIPGEDVRTFIIDDYTLSFVVRKSLDQPSNSKTGQTKNQKFDLSNRSLKNQSHAPHDNLPEHLERKQHTSSPLTTSDYRDFQQATLQVIDLPRNTLLLAKRIAKAFGLRFTAIDWRMQKNGELVFLEANPAPMFAGVEKQLSVPITQKLVASLLRTP